MQERALESNHEYLFMVTPTLADDERLPVFKELLLWAPEDLAKSYEFESVDIMFECFGIEDTEDNFMKLKVEAYNNLFGGMPLTKMLDIFYRSQYEKES